MYIKIAFVCDNFALETDVFYSLRNIILNNIATIEIYP